METAEKQKNSRQRTVFGEAGNGTVAGISELVRPEGLEFSEANPMSL